MLRTQALGTLVFDSRQVTAIHGQIANFDVELGSHGRIHFRAEGVFTRFAITAESPDESDYRSVLKSAWLRALGSDSPGTFTHYCLAIANENLASERELLRDESDAAVDEYTDLIGKAWRLARQAGVGVATFVANCNATTRLGDDELYGREDQREAADEGDVDEDDSWSDEDVEHLADRAKAVGLRAGDFDRFDTLEQLESFCETQERLLSQRQEEQRTQERLLSQRQAELRAEVERRLGIELKRLQLRGVHLTSEGRAQLRRAIQAKAEAEGAG